MFVDRFVEVHKEVLQRFRVHVVAKVRGELRLIVGEHHHVQIAAVER